jgi:pimeloyl-ACP methyl ester carboxylesterase
MKEQARNHVNRKLSESGGTAKPTGAVAGEFVTETFEYDGGRQVTVYVPPNLPQAIIFAGDGQRISKWGRLLEMADVPSTMIVGVHGLTDETLRLHEYSPGFDPVRFASHEKFFVEDVRRWTESRLGVALPTERTAVFGVSAGGELALALGLRASACLRCSLLRLAWRRLQAAWRYAESASAHLPCRWHSGAVLPREREDVDWRAAPCRCGCCHE